MAEVINLEQYKQRKEANRKKLEELLYSAVAKMNAEASKCPVEAIDRLLWDLGYSPEDLLDP